MSDDALVDDTERYGVYNRILENLMARDYALIQPHLEYVPLSLGHRLESPNQKIKHAYFLESGLASVLAVGDGRCSEIGIVGPDGMTGIPIVLGADRSPNEVVVQADCYADRISAADLREAMRTSESLARCLLRCAHVFLVQCGHTALANALGKIEERLARRLLMELDQADTDELVLTHQFLSEVLGVRRAGVTEALHKLEEQGVISAVPGRISIVDRDGLEQCANGLYGVPEAELLRLFPVKPWA
jgi:CRP-like cAMP-binding protein